MTKPPSNSIGYLKALEKMARKYKADITFHYSPKCKVWFGYYETNNRVMDMLEAHDKSFTTMLQKLHYEVKRKENL